MKSLKKEMKISCPARSTLVEIKAMAMPVAVIEGVDAGLPRLVFEDGEVISITFVRPMYELHQ